VATSVYKHIEDTTFRDLTLIVSVNERHTAADRREDGRSWPSDPPAWGSAHYDVPHCSFASRAALL
jgi:hypothetical protein